MTPHPTGTVAFLFTDIEGSTRLWEQFPEAMQGVLAQHDALLRDLIEAHTGFVVKSTGDGVHAAFERATDAVAAAAACAVAVQSADWDAAVGPLKVRMGVHAGQAQRRQGDYFGPALNRAARLMEIAHGGQILVSQAVEQLVRDAPLKDVRLKDLGKHRLRDLTQPERVFQVLHPQLSETFPALRSLDHLPNNLPAQLSSFIGREDELKQLKAHLEQTRLLSLVGVGGCGKTRLSLQLGADAIARFPDGVWFVELASISEMQDVPKAVAKVLNIQPIAGQSWEDAIAERYEDRQCLLILDNCEHLLQACAQLVDLVVKSCHKLRVVVTSREGLGVAGELTYTVPSLAVPNPDEVRTEVDWSTFPAVRLFLERATFSNPRFQLSEENTHAVVEVCRRLDGIPLAIELAATRVKAMAVEDIAKRLQNRFRLLTGGSRTALPRQQTLRAAIDWSHALLSEAEQQLFARLSVFSGGFTLEAAEAVCVGGTVEGDAVMDGLIHLVEKSLVQVDESAHGTRYRLLETLRQYASEKLLDRGETEAVYGRHLAYFLSFVEANDETLTRLDAETENLIAALRWSLEDQLLEDGAKLCAAIANFNRLSRVTYEDQYRWAGRALECESVDAKTKARLLYVKGWAALRNGRTDEALALSNELEPVAQRLDDKTHSVNAHALRGAAHSMNGHHAEAIVCYESAVELAGKWVPQIAHGFATNMTVAYSVSGRDRQAERLFEQQLKYSRAEGRLNPLVFLLYNFGNFLRLRGHLERAKALHEESVEILNDQRHEEARGLQKLFRPQATGELGAIARAMGQFEEAGHLLREGLRGIWENNDYWQVWQRMDELAALWIDLQEFDHAAQLLGAADALLERSRWLRGVAYQRAYDGYLAALGKAMSANAFQAAYERGKSMRLKDAVAWALSQTPDGAS